MKVVNKVLMDMDGNAIQATSETPLTVALVLMNAALTPLNADGSRKQVQGNESVERFMFAIKMRQVSVNESFEVTAQDIVQYTEELPKLYPPLVSGQCIAMLEGKL